MRLEGSNEVAASRQATWDALADPRVLARCMQLDAGLKLEVVDQTHLRVTGRVGAKFFPIAVAGDLQFEDLVPPDSLSIAMTGGAMGTHVAGRTIVSLVDGSPGTTAVGWVADVELTGPLASTGLRLLENETPRLVQRLFDCLRLQIGPER